MPIDFAEPSPRGKDGPNAAAGDHFGPSKAHAMQLEGQAVPELVRRLGDVKLGRISNLMLEEYLNSHTLVWDRDLLRAMCEEADYKHEGSIDTPAMVAALSGRFPKRKHTADWRKLAAILLGVPKLVLAEDTVHVAERAGLSDDFWTLPPKPLPPVVRRIRAAESAGEWKAVSGTLGAGGTGLGSSISGTSIGTDGASTSGRTSPAGGAPDSLDNLMLAHASCFGGVEVVNAVLLTSAGVKTVTPSPMEMSINASIAETGRSTFAGLKEFSDYTQGLQMTPGLGVDTAMLASAMYGATWRDDPIPSCCGATTRSTKAYEASLPPTSITMSPSALGQLRTSIRATAATQSHFEVRTRRLDTSAADMKKTLGAPRENDMPLSRVEPLRDTHTLYNASYTTWGGANGNDRTAPGRWINDHPASITANSEPRKYPWG